MADYEKLDENSAFFTGAVCGQLYVKFLAFEGLDGTYTKENKPAISVKVDGQDEPNSIWNFNPKRLNQVDEILVRLRSRNSKVRIVYRDPTSLQEIGSSTIEPARMPNTQLATLWFKIHDTARVLVHAYWGALEASGESAASGRLVSSTTFTMILDRPSYVPGETVAGVIIYRPHGPTSLRSLQLQVVGYSRQISNGDYPDENTYTFFSHQAILLGKLEDNYMQRVASEYYLWTFNFPLPYNIPPSGAAAGNYYHLLMKEVTPTGRTGKSKKIHFGIDRVFYPPELLAPAIAAPPPAAPSSHELPTKSGTAGASASPPATDVNLLALSHSAILEGDDLVDVRRSVHIAKFLDEDSMGDSEDEEDAKKQKKKKNKHSTSTDASIPKSPRHSEPNNTSHGSATDGVASPRSESVVEDKKTPRKRAHKKLEEEGGNSSEASDEVIEEVDEVPVAAEVPEQKQGTKAGRRRKPGASEAADPGTTTRRENEKVGGGARAGEVVSPRKVAAGPGSGSGANVRIPMRVRPGLSSKVVPSSGVKRLRLPIEVENTTNKPLEKFYVSVNYLEERTFRGRSVLQGIYEYTNVFRVHYKRFKFKNETGWPLQVGQKWKGIVDLSLSEAAPASVDAASSPIFTRTYYAKVHASAKGLFTRNKVSKKYLLLVGDYDWNTRPFPIQHAYTVPVRFTIFTLPCGPSAPTFITDKSQQIFEPAPPALSDLEQSEAINLEESIAL